MKNDKEKQLIRIDESKAMMVGILDEIAKEDEYTARRPARKKALPKKNGKPTGTWVITKMEQWDEDYFNMERQAFITIFGGGTGDFEFGTVSGGICGEFRETSHGVVFDFTWEGNEECDEVSGDGWFRSVDGKNGEGEIRFHQGDKSLFWAKKVRPRKGRKRRD
jgi:hypothetical protein